MAYGSVKIDSIITSTQTVTVDNLVTATSTNTLTNKTLTSPILTTPALGTPSSGTLTSCTDLPISGLTASTSTALGVGSIELGNANDTTLSRSAAGVLAVEGVVIPSVSSTNTLTNKTLTAPTVASANLTTALTLAGAAGTAGQVLTSAGSGLPTWASPNSGSFAFVNSVTATGAGSALLNSGFTSTYDVYELVIFAVTSNNNAQVRLRYEIAGSVITTSTYQYNKGEAQFGYPSAGSFTYLGSASPASYIELGSVGNASIASLNATIRIYRPSNTSICKQVVWAGSTHRIETTFLHGNGLNTATGALTGLELTPDGGTITCTMRLYGIANS